MANSKKLQKKHSVFNADVMFLITTAAVMYAFFVTYLMFFVAKA